MLRAALLGKGNSAVTASFDFLRASRQLITAVIKETGNRADRNARIFLPRFPDCNSLICPFDPVCSSALIVTFPRLFVQLEKSSPPIRRRAASSFTASLAQADLTLPWKASCAPRRPPFFRTSVITLSRNALSARTPVALLQQLKRLQLRRPSRPANTP